MPCRGPRHPSIFRNAVSEGALWGLTIERSGVIDALTILVEDGLAKAYLLSSREPCVTELQGMPPLDFIPDDFNPWFYITKKGMEFHLSDDTPWPCVPDHDMNGE